MFQPTKEWVNKVNLSSFELENFFKFGACVISARKAKQLDATTMFTYSHANTALGQSERAYYLSYFINRYVSPQRVGFFAPFWSENGYRFCPFWSDFRVWFTKELRLCINVFVVSIPND